MNLANDQATAEAYPGYAETYYAGQNIIFLNLGVDFQAPDFQEGLANGLRHFASNPGVYYVHCTEGKDRAGFVSALLECFMGATYDEVVADYLKTYTNYYTVVDGVQQPLSEETLNAIAESNIIKTLKSAFDVEDLKTANLAAEADEYITAIGLSSDEIAALKTNLGGAAEPELHGYVPAESVEAGDQILYVVEYEGAHYAMSNDTSVNNALGAVLIPEVAFQEDGTIDGVPVNAVWTLDAGADGKFQVKDANGKYISAASGSSTVKLADAGVDFDVVLGVGSSGLDIGTRRIFLRNNNGVMQFRNYAKSNMTSSGYCAVLTIYKYVP